MNGTLNTETANLSASDIAVSQMNSTLADAWAGGENANPRESMQLPRRGRRRS